MVFSVIRLLITLKEEAQEIKWESFFLKSFEEKIKKEAYFEERLKGFGESVGLPSGKKCGEEKSSKTSLLFFQNCIDRKNYKRNEAARKARNDADNNFSCLQKPGEEKKLSSFFFSRFFPKIRLVFSDACPKKLLCRFPGGFQGVKGAHSFTRFKMAFFILKIKTGLEYFLSYSFFESGTLQIDL